MAACMTAVSALWWPDEGVARASAFLRRALFYHQHSSVPLNFEPLKRRKGHTMDGLVAVESQELTSIPKAWQPER